MVMSATRQPLNFYTELLNRGGFIQVRMPNNQWVKVTSPEMLQQAYAEKRTFRIPLINEQQQITGVNIYSDLTKEEQEQLSLEAECCNPND